jgi:hypothetical protein
MTRQELYDLVWSMPLARAAATLGMAHLTLKKVCQESLVPLPPHGYWRKSRQNRERDRIPLPAAGPERIWKRRSLKRSHPPAGPVVPPRQRSGWHFSTINTASALRMAEPDNRGALIAKGVGVADISVSLETVDRALGVLDALIQTAEAAGHSIAKTAAPAMLSINGAHVPLTISEKFYRDSTTADAEEFRRRQEYERRYPKFYRRMDLTNGWTHRPSGKLSIILSRGQYITGIPNQWHDLASHPVESRLPEVVEAAIEHAEVISARQRKIEERLAERRAEEEQQHREDGARAQLEARTASCKPASMHTTGPRKQSAIFNTSKDRKIGIQHPKPSSLCSLQRRISRAFVRSATRRLWIGI